ncbi:hypothetical protein JCM6882_001096 [Rhodosporidiobolus microsporus]
MTVPDNGWNDIVKICERWFHGRGVDLRPTICAGVIWQAVVHAIERVEYMISDAQDERRTPPAHELQRQSMLQASQDALKRKFEALPAAGELQNLLVEALEYTIDFAAEANHLTTKSWSHGETRPQWAQAKEIQTHQLHVLRALLSIDVVHHIYDPLLSLGVDRTTLTLLGLNVDQRSHTQSPNRVPEEEVFRRVREMQEQRAAGGGGGGTMREMGRRGMPLARMGYRQRLQYAGAY